MRSIEPGIHFSVHCCEPWIPGLRLQRKIASLFCRYGASRNDGNGISLANDGAIYLTRGGFFPSSAAIAEISGFMKKASLAG